MAAPVRPWRARLQHAAQQNQRDDDGGCLEIDVAGRLGQPLRREGGHHGIAPGGAGAQRHQRVHLGRAPPQGHEALAEEVPARPGQHQRGQRELQQPAVLPADIGQHPVVHGGNQVRAHLQHEDGQGQGQRDAEGLLQAAGLGVAGLGLAFGVIVLGGDGAGLVADLADGVHQRLGVGGGRVEGDPRALGGQIHLGLGHARHAGQGLLDALDAGRAGHALDGELQLAGRGGDGDVHGGSLSIREAHSFILPIVGRSSLILRLTFP